MQTILPRRRLRGKDLNDQIKAHLELIRDQINETEAMHRSSKKALRDLREKSLKEVYTFLSVHRQSCLSRANALAQSARTRQRTKGRATLETLAARDKAYMEQIMIKKYEAVLTALRRLRDQSVMQDTKDLLQSVIVKLETGDKEPALTYLRQEASRQGQIASQKRYHGTNWLHKRKQNEALDLVELLEN